MELAERAELLAAQLIQPLLLGGELRLQRPFGPRRALDVGVERRVVDNDLRVTIDNARLRAARSLLAVDLLPELGATEWTLAAALNDLLQVTNHELSTFASRSRHATLLDATGQICAAIAPPACLQEAVARHATLGRALRLYRTDTTVTWWTGSSRFRGQPPAPRVLAWPELRNVQAEEGRVGLVDMANGVPVARDTLVEAIGRWLACSPLTDLATVGRSEPAFGWSSHTLTLVASVAGQNLALRAFRQHEISATAWRRACEPQCRAALAALGRATAALGPAPPVARVAESFVDSFAAATAAWIADAQSGR